MFLYLKDWFQRQFLNTPESQSLRVDIMRYICVVIHPTNEQLNAGLTPRWALCGWLINTCTNPVESANLKLALFYDWLLYDSKKDNIMLIEPGILLLFNAMRVAAGAQGSAGINVNMASMLFDFLCRISSNYHWPLRDQVLNGIISSFRDTVDKRVIPSMQVFLQPNEPGAKFPQPSLDRDLRTFIQSTFGNFMPIQTPLSSQVLVSKPSTLNVDISFKKKPNEIEEPLLTPNSVDFIDMEFAPLQPSFSDDDEESKPEPKSVPNPGLQVIIKQLQQFSVKPFKVFAISEDALSNHALLLDNHLNLIPSDELRDKLSEFHERLSSTDQVTSINFFTNMFKDILGLVYRDQELLNNFNTSLTDLAVSICLVLKKEFSNNILPSHFYDFKPTKVDSSLFIPSPQTLNTVHECLNQRMIFVLFKELSQTTNQSMEREVLTQLLQEIYLKQSRVGYLFLLFIYATSLKTSSAAQATEVTSSLIRIYSEFSKERQNEIRLELKARPREDSSSEKASEPDEDDSDKSSPEEDDEESIYLSESQLVLGECLMQDIRLCQQDDPHLFLFLVPFFSGPNLLPNFMLNNNELVYLIVSCIDARQLKELVACLMSQEMVLLREDPSKEKSEPKRARGVGKKMAESKKRKRTSSQEDREMRSRRRGNGVRKSLIQVLEASLLWESIEQTYFWYIIGAHDDLGIESLLPIMGKLEASHSEALLGLYKMLRNCEPTFDLVKLVVMRHVDEAMDRALFIHWIRKASSGKLNYLSFLNQFCRDLFSKELHFE